MNKFYYRTKNSKNLLNSLIIKFKKINIYKKSLINSEKNFKSKKTIFQKLIRFDYLVINY